MHRLLLILTVSLLYVSAAAQTPAQLSVPRLQLTSGGEWWQEIDAAMENGDVPFVMIDRVGWSEQYPYKPQVKFRIAYTESDILLQYDVVEQGTRATWGTDEGARPYMDSCVEFFVAPYSDSLYYNLEVTCIGVATFDGGPMGGERPRAGSEVMQQIRRHSSLGAEPFGDTSEQTQWRLTIAMPINLILPEGESIEGRTMRANFYKCGDQMAVPHYLSWSPIEWSRPNFHLPDQFGYLQFE